MSENPPSPGWGGKQDHGPDDCDDVEVAGSRPASKHSRQSRSSNLAAESTPLLSRGNEEREYGADGNELRSAATSLESLQGQLSSDRKGKSGPRWPTLLAVVLLGTSIILVILAGFFAPAVAREYASEAVVVEAKDLSVDSFTPNGLRARVQAIVGLDASRVRNSFVRNMGRFGTRIVGKVESQPTTVKVYVPEYGNVLVGEALVPRLVLDIRNGHWNHLDFLTDLQPGQLDGIRTIANDWLEGRLGELRVLGKVDLRVKMGGFSLGTRTVTESFAFEGHDLPAIPDHNLTRFDLHQVETPTGENLTVVEATVTIENAFPINLAVPPLAFDMLVPNCSPKDPSIHVASAETEPIHIRPHNYIEVDVKGVIRRLPATLTRTCPDSDSSPLDEFIGSYLHGQDTTVLIRGSGSQPSETPQWLAEIMSSVTVPVPLTGHTFHHLMKSFSLANVHVSLPDPLADPDSPEGQTRISAVAKAFVGLPQQMNVPVDVSRVRADAEIFYHGRKLGNLDLRKWQQANSSRIEPVGDDDSPTLLVESVVDDAPMRITDDQTFSDLVQALLFGSKPVPLTIKADVDVDISMALGQFVIKKVPTQGKVSVNPLSSRAGALGTEVGGLKITGPSKDTLSIDAKVNFTNPTDYSVDIPYFNINILSNGSVMGNTTVRNMKLVPGHNADVAVEATWDPLGQGDKKAKAIGKELLSRFISGYNTTVTLRTHQGTIPNQPGLGRALASMALEVPTPKLKIPHLPGEDDDDDDDGPPSMIGQATMHLLTSTVTFIFRSPLPETTMYITHMDATAYYKHVEPIGTIQYDLPFPVPPGISETPRLPVHWSLESVGYDAIKAALGGDLKLDTKAFVGLRIDKFEETVWFVGRGIGSKVTL